MGENPWWAPWVLSRIGEPLMRSLTVQAAEMAEMKAGDRALDVCCGTGGLALHYAGLGVIATGIDLDLRALQVAEKKRLKLGLTTASFQTASALNLPFKNDSFDYASISMSLHENERTHRDTMISEMKRVTKDEGALVFIDYMVPLPRTPSSCAAKLVELVAGKDHNRCFKDYVEQGGLCELLKRNRLCEEKRSELRPLEMVLAKLAEANQCTVG